METSQKEELIAAELLKFGGEGVGAGKFKDNRAIAVDPDGKIYAADFSGGRIQIFDADGVFQTQIMADTSKTVDALAVDRKDNLYVLQGYDIHRFDAKTNTPLGKYRVDYASDLAVGLDGKFTSRPGVVASTYSAPRARRSVLLSSAKSSISLTSSRSRSTGREIFICWKAKITRFSNFRPKAS
jgi:DNA-binding beta-propeller fold protein YncE